MEPHGKSSIARDVQLVIAFAAPYVIALPLFVLQARMSGGAAAFAPGGGVPLDCGIVAGLVGVMCSRRDWITRAAAGLFYLVITFVVLTGWVAFMQLSRESL